MAQILSGKTRLLARATGAILAFVCAICPVAAQDVTLISRNGALSVVGTLTSYDGEFYRVSSAFGPLTITAASVLCEGPACPDLTAPKAVIRFTGDGEAGAALLPKLFAAFATARGFDLRAPNGNGAPTELVQPDMGAVLGEFYFTPRSAEAARSAMADASADLVVARFTPLDAAAKLLALDALVPIVSPQNLAPRISTSDLAAALSGKVTNWAQIGGADMPIVLHGLEQGSDVSAALAARLGAPADIAQVHPDLGALAIAVARDPWALGVTGRANAAPARVLPLTDSCGFVLNPSSLSVKTDDYPLTLPVYLLTPPRRLPLLAREFLDFLALPAAQAAIAQAGFVARDIEGTALANDSARLINAIKAAPDQDAMPALQRLVLAMETANRLSFSFRFEDGSTDLDLASTQYLADLAQHIAAGRMTASALTLTGFVPSSGDIDADLALSVALAEKVQNQLMQLAPDLPAATWPAVEGFGAALPLACDSTPAGQRLNRRVELWAQAAP